MMNRLRQFERHRILMWLVLLFAVTNTAMLVYADADDDPVTTKVEFCFTNAPSGEATNAIEQAGQRTSHLASSLSAGAQHANGRLTRQTSVSVASTAARCQAPLRC